MNKIIILILYVFPCFSAEIQSLSLLPPEYPIGTWVKYDLLRSIDDKTSNISYYLLSERDNDGKLAKFSSLIANGNVYKNILVDGNTIPFALDRSGCDQISSIGLVKGITEHNEGENGNGLNINHYSGLYRGWSMDVTLWESPNKNYPFRSLSYPLGEIAIPSDATRIQLSMVKNTEYFSTSSLIINENAIHKIFGGDLKCIEEYVDVINRGSEKILMICSARKLSSHEAPFGLVYIKSNGLYNGQLASSTTELVQIKLNSVQR
jgi:hypothetical protein